MDLPPLRVDEKNPILKKTKAGTGIPDLDIMLEGGYQNPGLIMVTGPTCTEKMAFAFHFAHEGVVKKEKVIYIAADSSPEDLINKASSIGIELPVGKEITFIDCYTATLGNKEGGKEHISVAGPSALNDLSIAINEAIKENSGAKIRVVFHSLSSFVLYNPTDSLLKFLQVVGGRLKNAEATALMLVEEGMHEKQLISSIEHMMDEKFAIHDTGGTFELNIPEVAVQVPIRISASGIMVV